MYPRGVQQPALIADVARFVEEFLYLRRADLLVICAHHGILVSRQEKRVFLLDAVRLRKQCQCSLQVSLSDVEEGVGKCPFSIASSCARLA